MIQRPELELLALCARRSADPETDARIRTLLGGPLDFAALLALAERHRMIPLLHRHLRTHGDALPASFSADLRKRVATGAPESLRKAGELHRLVAALRAAGVAVLAYKGPALAVEAYGDVGLRTLSDLDLLVAPADVPRALAALAAAGYAPAHALTPAREKAFRRTDGDYPLVHGGTGALVELHAHLSSLRFGVRLPTEQVMARARPVRVGGAEVPVPAADDLLLALALHGAKHRWARLEWVASFAELARAHPAAVTVALARAPGLGAERVFVLALALAAELTGVPLPFHAARAVGGDGTVAALVAELVARMERGADEDGEGDAAGNLLFNLRLREGAAQRSLYAWRWLTLPTPEDWNAVDLPDALHPLYRALRPVRLLARYAPRPRRGRAP